MARPRNPEESVEVTIRVTPRIAQWLDELATIGNFGNQRAAVAQNFVLAGGQREAEAEAALRPSVENAVRYVADARTEVERAEREQHMNAVLGVEDMSRSEIASLGQQIEIAQAKITVERQQKSVAALTANLQAREREIGRDALAVTLGAAANANAAAGNANAATELGAASINAQSAERVVGAMEDVGDVMRTLGDRAALNADRMRAGLDGQRDHIDSRLDSLDGRLDGLGDRLAERAAPPAEVVVHDDSGERLVAAAEELLRK